MRSVLLPLCLAGVLAATTEQRAQGGLAQESPFLPAPGAGSAAAADNNAQLELRGVMVNGAETLFNIVNVATKRGVWVALKETGRDYIIKSHEMIDDTDTVTVEFQGRTLRLALAKAKTASSGRAQAVMNAPPQPTPMPTIPGMPPNPTPPTAEGPISPVVLNPSPADEARRLEAVAAEVRRRRALRQQPNPTPNTPPGTTPQQQ